MAIFFTDTKAPTRKLFDICRDSPAIKAAYEKQERAREVDFFEALQLLKDIIFLRIEELELICAKKVTKSHPEAAELRALRRYEKDIEALTPSNLNALFAVVDAHDEQICTSRTLPTSTYEGEKRVTNLLLHWIRDLSRF